MLLRLDDPGSETVGEEVSEACVPLIEGLRVQPVQPSHAVRQLDPRRSDDEVVVRRHQAHRLDGPATGGRDAFEQREE
jgi:hypothetical protein